MKSMRSIFVLTGLLLSSMLFGQFGTPAPSPVKVTLSYDGKQVSPGDAFKVGVRFELEPEWHIYAKDAEAGVPTSIEWQLPKGVTKKGEMIWPKPIKLEIQGLITYGYEGKVVVVQEFVVAPDAAAGPVELGATASYGACGEGTCLPPSDAELKLTVAIGTSTTRHEKRTGAGATPRQPAAKGKAPQPSKTKLTLIAAIGFAFLGGMILNLMPCVLPVLSIKIMGLMNQAHEGKGAWQHGAAFGAGVLASFWTLAGILIVLRQGSKTLGWGFQLQQPLFVLGLLSLMFVMALTFFGVFEIGMSLTAVGQGKQHSGLTGSFLSGIMATLIATPCTAPFMGTALGFALTQPAAVSMLVFTALGVGMALPYVLLTSFPPLLKYVPKPGAWMESLKQFMGFPLMATVVWLLYVLFEQVGGAATTCVMLGLIVVAVGAWVYGRWTGLEKAQQTRNTARAIAGGLLLLGLIGSGIAIEKFKVVPKPSGHLAIVRAARKTGKPVFIDYTASWCLTCQANKAAFTKEVEAKFKQKDVVTIIADWTRKDPEITQALESYGRSGVPLYVLYYPGAEDPVFLPQLLTPGIILAELDKLP